MADLIFTCWTTSLAGELRRLEVVASCDQDARDLVFASCPAALAVSCRAGAHCEERRHG
jgi:hypothetical protein